MLSLADEDSQVIIPDPLLTELIISSRGIQLVHLQGVSQKASNMKIDQPSFLLLKIKRMQCPRLLHYTNRKYRSTEKHSYMEPSVGLHELAVLMVRKLGSATSLTEKY